MRLLLVLATALLLTATLTGCFERRGGLVVQLAVSPEGAIDEFRSIPVSLQKLQIDARTLNPEDFPPAVSRLDLVEVAASGQPVVLFNQQIRADTIEKVTVGLPPGSTVQGTFANGTSQGVVVPDGRWISAVPFDLPRGGSVTYTMTVVLKKEATGQGPPLYQAVLERSLTGARSG